MNAPRVVLLGSAGTGTAFGAACALRRVWGEKVTLVTMDINPRHLVTGTLLADHFEQVPLSAAPDFPAVLLDIIQRHEVRTYMPLFPEEIALAAKLRDEGKFSKLVTVMAPTATAGALCADKWALTRLLEKKSIGVPRTDLASNPFAEENLFLKPRSATGSRGARKVKAAELPALVGESAPDWVVQEICSPPEVTVDAFYDPSTGFSHVVCRERIEIKSGVSTKARLFADEELQRVAASIAKALELAGSFCFQVMRNPTGWVVTDVNPRPGAATAMCATVGSDFFAASFARCWGEDPQPLLRPLVGEHFVTRQYSEFVMGPLA